jgi:hypothetical protein
MEIRNSRVYLGRDIDRLADELRTYDNARGLETQDVIDNVRALRQEELQVEEVKIAAPTCTVQRGVGVSS